MTQSLAGVIDRLRTSSPVQDIMKKMDWISTLEPLFIPTAVVVDDTWLPVWANNHHRAVPHSDTSAQGHDQRDGDAAGLKPTTFQSTGGSASLPPEPQWPE